jgi:Zn-dependent metalloprotease
MPQSDWHRHTIYCILPPHILHSMEQNGSHQERAAAQHTLGHDHSFRMARRGPFSATAGSAPQADHLRRTIFDARSTEELPGVQVRREGDPETQDSAVSEAYNGLGATYTFYRDVYQRDSIDGHGLPLLASVHFSQNYDNAFWDGKQMVFGDGDGRVLRCLTDAIDVIGHELTHGVTGSESGLAYERQAGALNESISDVFGSLVKQYALRQTADKADWLIGAGILAPHIHGVALRSMKRPGTAYDDPLLGRDPQPGHMRDFVQTDEDNGGVHINSGIPNHAFCLTALHLGGYAWERAGRVWYETVRDSRLPQDANFLQFAQLTVDNAARLFGAGSEEQRCVILGWSEVGIAAQSGAFIPAAGVPGVSVGVTYR